LVIGSGNWFKVNSLREKTEEKRKPTGGAILVDASSRRYGRAHANIFRLTKIHTRRKKVWIIFSSKTHDACF